MNRFIESLERRQLLSVAPSLHPIECRRIAPAALAPIATALSSVVGTYTGSILVSGVHTQPVKVVISSQAADGTIAGTLTSPADSNLVAKVGGKVLANNAIAMTLGNSSGHAGGPIAGTGSGTFTVSGTKITMSINFNFTSPFLATGKLTLSGTQAVQTSIVVTPPATQTATAGKSKSFALGSFTQRNATGPFTIDVNWGDGSAHTKFTQSAAGTITPKAHTFTKAVTDAVSVTITDAKGHLSNMAKFNVVVSPSTATKLVFVKQPAGTTVAGKAISPAVMVAIEDSFGNVVTTNTSKVTIAKNTGPTGSTLTGTLAVNAVKGIATFSNLVLKTAGSYTLKATDGLLAAAISSSFKVIPAAVAKLAIIRQPVRTLAGKPIFPAVLVAVEDAFGNVVTSSSAKITITKNSGPAGSTLTGTLSVNAVKGIATFSNLILKPVGSYSLKASDGVRSVISVIFGIV